MDKPRIGQKKEQAVKNKGANNVEVTADDDASHLDHETGGANGDKDSNVSAAAGNPNGRGPGKDPGPLTRETDRHDSQTRKEQKREMLVKERVTVPATDVRRGDLDAVQTDRGGTYSNINNGHPADTSPDKPTGHDGSRRGEH